MNLNLSSIRDHTFNEHSLIKQRGEKARVYNLLNSKNPQKCKNQTRSCMRQTNRKPKFLITAAVTETILNIYITALVGHLRLYSTASHVSRLCKSSFPLPCRLHSSEKNKVEAHPLSLSVPRARARYL